MIKMLHSYGYSLLEVLMATFILTFGLLGIAGISITVLQRAENAYWHTLAISQAVSLTEQKMVYAKRNSETLIPCQQLLPSGVCMVTARKTLVCWRSKHERRCCEIKAKK